MSHIYFCKVHGDYGFLSNNAITPFLDSAGNIWRTVTHYFEAQKFDFDESKYQKIRRAKAPQEALNMAKRFKRSPGHISIWERQGQFVAMAEALRYKFTQYPSLGDRLVSTGEDVIIFDNKRDWLWGAGQDGDGVNMMGKTIMKIREELRRLSFARSGRSALQNSVDKEE